MTKPRTARLIQFILHVRHRQKSQKQTLPTAKKKTKPAHQKGHSGYKWIEEYLKAQGTCLHKRTHVNHLLYWLEKSGSDARQQMCAGLTNRQREREREGDRGKKGFRQRWPTEEQLFPHNKWHVECGFSIWLVPEVMQHLCVWKKKKFPKKGDCLDATRICFFFFFKQKDEARLSCEFPSESSDLLFPYF